MLVLGFFIGGDILTPVKMFFSYNNNEKVVEVPAIPNTLPAILQELQNETFTTNTATLTLLGNKKPRSFSMDLFLPTKEYDFAKDTGTEILNIAVLISSFKYYFDRAENIRCNVSFIEYIFITSGAIIILAFSVNFDKLQAVISLMFPKGGSC